MAAQSDRSSEAPPLFDLKDLEKGPLFLFLGAAAWVLPARAWPVVANWVARMSGRVFASRRQIEAARVPRIVSELTGGTAEELLPRYTAGFYEEYMQVLRTYRPGGWQPQLRVQGAEHLAAAQAAGKGAILWVADSAFSPLVVKMALSTAGFRATNLSRPQHGFSRTRFGMRFLNPIQRRAEDRFLGGRVVIEDDRNDLAMRSMLACLRRNEIVAITVGNQARRVERVPMFGGVLEVATGPAHLCHRTGAPLLPGFLWPLGPDSFELRIGAPLMVATALAGPRRYTASATEYASLLEDYIRAQPMLWRGWVEHGNWKALEDEVDTAS